MMCVATALQIRYTNDRCAKCLAEIDCCEQEYLAKQKRAFEVRIFYVRKGKTSRKKKAQKVYCFLCDSCQLDAS